MNEMSMGRRGNQATNFGDSKYVLILVSRHIVLIYENKNPPNLN